MLAASTGFPPVARADARILILGSLPGQRSLQAKQYYAHPRNAFWRIMRELVAAEGTYEQRCRALNEHGIALWDVLARSVRPGSLDANIRSESAEVNDFDSFFSTHSAIVRIAFNGQKAAQLFGKLVSREPGRMRHEQLILPSTSPAYASMPFTDKLAKWRSIVS